MTIQRLPSLSLTPALIAETERRAAALSMASASSINIDSCWNYEITHSKCRAPQSSRWVTIRSSIGKSFPCTFQPSNTAASTDEGRIGATVAEHGQRRRPERPHSGHHALRTGARQSQAHHSRSSLPQSEIACRSDDRPPTQPQWFPGRVPRSLPKNRMDVVHCIVALNFR